MPVGVVASMMVSEAVKVTSLLARTGPRMERAMLTRRPAGSFFFLLLFLFLFYS